MKYLALTFLLLTACSNSQPTPTPAETLAAQQRAADYKLLRHMGYSDEKAKEMMSYSSEADDKRATAREAQRQRDIDTVISGACKNDPGLSYC